MKNIIIIITAVLILNTSSTFAQEYNWNSLKDNRKHLLHLTAGLENGIIFGVGYGYQLSSKIPIIIGGEYSLPAGKNLIDDLKTKIGGHIRLIKIHNFCLSAKVQGIYRRYENNLVRMDNFGTYVGGNVGFYSPKLFAALEFGFDKAIVTYFKHGNSYREIYQEAVNGWYQPATGGNYNYGIMAGYSFKKNDLYLRVGKLIAEDFKTDPFVPFYATIGYNYKIK